MSDVKSESQKLNEVASKIQKILDTAQKKADELIEAAEKRAEDILKSAKANERPAGKPRDVKKEPMVEIFLFKDDSKYKEDVTVSVNGKTYLIKRGVKVKVPLTVKEVLDNSARQDLAAVAYAEEQTRKYNDGLK